jgi:transcriptional regulator with XRE-family HTH domain
MLNDLKDRDTRQIFYSEHISTAIPIQIRELRKKRNYTQKKLGSLTEMDQGTISNLENPNYEYAPQIGTLERLANAFDVPLIVRFGSWEELWDWENNLTPERLAPKTFKEVLPKLEASVVKSETGVIRKVRNHPYGLITGSDESTPDRPLDKFLGRPSQSQRLGRETDAANSQDGLLAAAATGGRTR